MSDAISRLNATLEGRYAIERELGEGAYLADNLRLFLYPAPEKDHNHRFDGAHP